MTESNCKVAEDWWFKLHTLSRSKAERLGDSVKDTQEEKNLGPRRQKVWEFVEDGRLNCIGRWKN